MALSLTKEEFADVKKAGKIAAEAREFGKKLIRKDVALLEVTERVEEKIAQLGGSLAFPVNISSDNIAAHYAAAPDDTTILKEQVIKLDVGANINGWIGDTAATIDLSEKCSGLVDASYDALQNVIRMIKPGITLHEIGATVEKTIMDKGFQPIRNLSGHEIGKYIVHTGLTIPNYASEDRTEIEEGMLIAVEPFATTGIGLIKEHGTAEIFSIRHYKPMRVEFVREILANLEKNVKFMPFSRRALLSRFSLPQINYALTTFREQGILKQYPPLIEKGIVSQAEHSLYITAKGAQVLTATD